MNKDNFEGGVRSAVGHSERFVGAATDDKASEVRGAYDEVAGSAQSAWGSAKDAAKDMADSGSMPDLSRLRDDIAKLTQTARVYRRSADPGCERRGDPLRRDRRQAGGCDRSRAGRLSSSAAHRIDGAGGARDGARGPLAKAFAVFR